jgi:hypothetical protein
MGYIGPDELRKEEAQRLGKLTERKQSRMQSAVVRDSSYIVSA